MKNTNLLSPLLAIVLLLYPSAQLSANHHTELIVWNVGQGQWVTLSSSTFCVHFDAGGEWINWNDIKNECQGKQNQIFISHSDWDHISWVSSAFFKLKPTCLVNFPQEPLSAKKQQRLQPLRRCQTGEKRSQWHWIYHHPKQKKPRANDWSQVATVNQSIVIPGDSPKRQEKIWLLKIPAHIKRRINTLILGHHGSKTSTSRHLLKSLPHIRQAITSSRKAVYGHPHKRVTQDLKRRGIANVSTENWGHIRLRL